MQTNNSKNKLKVIHITADDKFFDGPFYWFESDLSLENKAYLTEFGHKRLKFIKSKDKVQILECKSVLKQILVAGDYDVVFFYSLPVERWWMVEAIPKEKVIIWWEWGFELYGSREGLEPLINISRYKPITEKYVKRRLRTFVQKLIVFFKYRGKKIDLYEQRKRVLKRIDYLMPVLPIDYECLRQYPEFNAKEFYKLGCTSFSYKTDIRPAEGGILLGNSALVSNNHLDIWDSLEKTGIAGRKIIVPLNYGESDTAAYVSRKIKSCSNEVMMLRTFMPRKDYFDLIDGCSYAVFGAMRQQAVANIRNCIRTGIKVFLYKDSMCYKSLTASGYKVFAIEDMDITALSTPMTVEDNKHNVEVFENEVKYKNRIYDEAMAEIRRKLL
jgi:hypothetical protein